MKKESKMARKKREIKQLLVRELEAMFDQWPDGFARHFEKRKDQEQLEGKSWSELLGPSDYLFWQIFDSIGVHYKNFERLPEEHEGRFQGKPYYAVTILSDHNRTHYFRNYELLSLQASTRDESSGDAKE